MSRARKAAKKNSDFGFAIPRKDIETDFDFVLDAGIFLEICGVSKDGITVFEPYTGEYVLVNFEQVVVVGQ